MGKTVLRGIPKILGSLVSGAGDNILTINSSTKDITNIPPLNGFLTSNLDSANILLGNASNIASPVLVSGAIAIDNTGSTSISAGAITDAHISNSAAINVSKLLPGTDTYVLTTVGGIVAWAASSGVNSVSGTANRISIVGTITDPIINISTSYTGQTSITTVGTITSGIWNGNSIDTAFITDSAITLSKTTMNTNKLIGRTTASIGHMEEIVVGSGLSLSGGVLTASGGAGTPFLDNSPLIENNLDNTKTATFDATSITTSTNRTYILQDFNGPLLTGGGVNVLGASSTTEIKLQEADDSVFKITGTATGPSFETGLFVSTNSFLGFSEANLQAGDGSQVSVNSAGGVSLVGSGSFNLAFGASAIFSDSRGTPQGIVYNAAGYATTDRSLTDRGYVLGTKTYTGSQQFRIGTTSAGTAPLYIPDSTALLTTPEDSALERKDSLGGLSFTSSSTRRFFTFDTNTQTLSNKTISGASNTITNISLTSSVTGRLPYANLVQGSALSVLGVTGNSIADNASITAASAGTFLSRNGVVVGFNSSITLPVTTGTGASAGFNLLANSLTTGNGIEFSSSSLTTGNIVSLLSTSTTIDNGVLLSISSSGANGTSAKTVNGLKISVTNTNATSGTNYASLFTASGATTKNVAVGISDGTLEQVRTSNFSSTVTMQSVLNNTTTEIFNLQSNGQPQWNLINTSGTKIGDVICQAGGGTNPTFSFRNSGATNRYDLAYVPSGTYMSLVNNTVATSTKIIIGVSGVTPTATLQVRGAGTTTGINFRTETSGGTSAFTINDQGDVSITRLLTVGNTITTATGTTAIAPMIIPAGTLLTSPVNSAVETAADKIYYTIPTGTARKEVALVEVTLTSGTYPVATTNGRLTDGAITTTNIVTDYKNYVDDFTVTGNSYVYNAANVAAFISNNSAAWVSFYGTGVDSTGANAYGFKIETVIKRDNSGNYAIVGVNSSDIRPIGATATVTISANQITVTVASGMTGIKNDLKAVINAKAQ